MTYNEYWQIIDAGLEPDDLITFKYEDQGVSTLEDGIYVLEDALKDEAFQEKMVRFVRASMKGWKWAEKNKTDRRFERRARFPRLCTDGDFFARRWFRSGHYQSS